MMDVKAVEDPISLLFEGTKLDLENRKFAIYRPLLYQ